MARIVGAFLTRIVELVEINRCRSLIVYYGRKDMKIGRNVGRIDRSDNINGTRI